MKVIELRDQFSLDNLAAAERPDPEPGPGQVVLAMRAASLNYPDWLLAQGGYGSVAGALPLIPVSDGVGEVVAVRAGVTRVAVGDRVCPIFFQGWIGGEPSQEAFATSLGGPLAQFMLLDQQGVVTVPEHLSDEAAVTLPCAALTAWSTGGDRLLADRAVGRAFHSAGVEQLGGALLEGADQQHGAEEMRRVDIGGAARSRGHARGGASCHDGWAAASGGRVHMRQK